MSASPLAPQITETLQRHVVAGAVAAALPFPWLGFVGLTGVQLHLLRQLSALYGVPFSQEIARSAIAALVGSDLSLGLSLGLAKLVAGPTLLFAAASGGLLGAASTYALGKVFALHFASGQTFLTFDPEKVRAHYEELFKAAPTPEGGSFAGIRP